MPSKSFETNHSMKCILNISAINISLAYLYTGFSRWTICDDLNHYNEDIKYQGVKDHFGEPLNW